MTPAKTLKAWRGKRGLTQSEAAALVGVHQSKWCRWERETHKPSAEEALKLSDVSDDAIPLSVWREAKPSKRIAKAS